jgi:hypothetical protein
LVVGAAAKQMFRVWHAAQQAQQMLEVRKAKDEFNYLRLADDTFASILANAPVGDGLTEEQHLPLDMFLPIRIFAWRYSEDILARPTERGGDEISRRHAGARPRRGFSTRRGAQSVHRRLPRRRPGPSEFGARQRD